MRRLRAEPGADVVRSRRSSRAQVQFFAAGRAPLLTVALVLMTGASIAGVLILPALIGTVVDRAVSGAGISMPVLALASVLALSTLLDVGSGWTSAAITTGAAVDLRRMVARRVLSGSVLRHRRFSAGDLTSTLVAGTANASDLVVNIVAVVGSVCLAVGGVAGLAVLHWSLAVVFGVCIPVSVLLMRRFVGQAAALSRTYQDVQGQISARLVEALTGARTIHATGLLDREVERVLAPLPELATAGRTGWTIQRDMVWKISLLAPMTEVSVLAVAGAQVAGGALTAGDWIAAAAYVALALGLFDVVDAVLELAHVRAGAGRVGDVLATPEPAMTARPLPAGSGVITFRSVSVENDDEVVLADVDLALPAGQLIAVVGRSGAGKSTFAALAGGLVQPSSGAVLLDGVAVGDLAASERRAAVAYAFERPDLLGETVHDAIAYGAPAATRDQVEAAATSAAADAFVRRLPAGYDTRLTAAPFSGGELQRLGLARALAMRSRVLILDDATSSLDTVTEAEISATLRDVFADRTRILVTHRPTTAAAADLVVWLADGRVRACAPHDQLWRKREYRALYSADEQGEDNV